MTDLIKWASAVFTDALFPRRCPVCDSIVISENGLICPSCLKELSFIKSPVCKKCGKELLDETTEYCFDCSRRRRSFEYGIGLVNYNETAAHSMIKIKYKNKREYLDFYIEAALMICSEKILQMGGDILLPVPVHPSRLRERGFNQAEILARGLGRGLGIPVEADILKRGKKTAPQKLLDPGARLKNLEEAFVAGRIPGEIKTAILVDDIYTTGSTIEACTRALKKAGIKKVYFFAVCIGQGQ